MIELDSDFLFYHPFDIALCSAMLARSLFGIKSKWPKEFESFYNLIITEERQLLYDKISQYSMIK